MALSQVGNTLSSLAPFALNWRGLGGYAHDSGADRTAASLNAATKRQAMSTDFGDDSAQVSLSAPARALAAFSGNGAGSSASGQSSGDTAGGSLASGSSDFGNEALYLGGMADASLVAMGIITPDQQAGTQITFSSLSYNVTDSESASISQQNGQTVAAYGSEQQAEFVGQGQITTADGRTFDFQIEVDLDQSQQVEASGNAAGSAQSNIDSAALAANAAPPVLPPTSDNGPSSIASPSVASADSINWDQILKQSQSLIDLLDSIGKESQAVQSNGANGANANAANAASGTNATNAAQGGSAAGASASPGAPDSSGSQNQPAASTPAAQAA
jgi:hypothetical protein